MSSKEVILKTALTLFATDGYENVGIQKIVETVGVKKPTLYHYFGSKQGLLTAIIDYYFEPFLCDLKISADYNGDIVLTLEEIVKKHFKLVKSSGKFYRFALSLMLSSENSEARISVNSYSRRQFDIIENVFIAAVKDHGNMAGRSGRYAMTFQGMIHTYITMYFYGNDILNDESAFNACHQFMHGIFS